MYVLKPMFPTWTPFFMPHPIRAERIWKEDEVRAIMMDKSNEHGLSYNGKPFCLGTATGLVRALEASNTLFSSYSVPFHINHGTNDPGVPVEGSKRLFEQCKTPDGDKELNIVEGGYHALFSQLDAEKTMQHEIDWMEARIEPKK